MKTKRLKQLLRHRLLWTIYVPSLLFSISNGFLTPNLGPYMNTFGVSYVLIGLALAASSIGMLAGELPATVWFRKLGHRRTMLVGATISTVATVALFWAPSIGAVLVLRFISGFAGALYHVGRHVYLSSMASSEKRGRSISLLGGIFRLGRVIGPAVGGTIGFIYGLRLPFVVYGLVSIAGLACIALFMRGDQQSAVGREASRKEGNLLDVLKSYYGILATAGAGQLFARLIRNGRANVLPLYASDVLGLNVQAIGQIESIASMMDFFMFIPAGWIMDRFGRKYALIPCFSIQALGMGLMAFTQDYNGLLITAMLIAFGNGLGAGSMMTLGADLAPAGARGEFLGLWGVIGDAGTIGGPLVMGVVADWLALPAAVGVIAAAGWAAAGIFGFIMPETRDLNPVYEPSGASNPADD